MKIVTRQEAIKDGLEFYFTGIPCKNGSLRVRRVATRDCDCSKCKQDRADAQRERRAANPEKFKKQRKSRYEKDPQKFHLSREKWVSRNPEKAREIRSRCVARWRKNNPDRAAATISRRRSRNLQATPRWMTDADWSQIRTIYEAARRLEKETGEKFHVDHIVPLRGKLVCGLHVPWNLRPVHWLENLKKSNKLEDDRIFAS